MIIAHSPKLYRYNRFNRSLDALLCLSLHFTYKTLAMKARKNSSWCTWIPFNYEHDDVCTVFGWTSRVSFFMLFIFFFFFVRRSRGDSKMRLENWSFIHTLPLRKYMTSRSQLTFIAQLFPIGRNYIGAGCVTRIWKSKVILLYFFLFVRSPLALETFCLCVQKNKKNMQQFFNQFLKNIMQYKNIQMWIHS